MNTYQYDLVKRMSFVRFGGTDEELQVAKMLQEEIEKFGGESHLEEFEIPAFELEKCSVKVVAPYEMEIEAIPYGMSGCLPEVGVDLKFMYAQNGEAADYYGIDDLSDTVVLLSGTSFPRRQVHRAWQPSDFALPDNGSGPDFRRRHTGPAPESAALPVRTECRRET